MDRDTQTYTTIVSVTMMVKSLMYEGRAGRKLVVDWCSMITYENACDGLCLLTNQNWPDFGGIFQYMPGRFVFLKTQ